MYSDDYYTKLSQLLCSYKLRKICWLPPKTARVIFSSSLRRSRQCSSRWVPRSPECQVGWRYRISHSLWKQRQRHNQMKRLNYLRMYWIIYQERLVCIGGDHHEGDTTYIASEGSTRDIVLIENQPVIGIAHIRAILDVIQGIIMKFARDICMVVPWLGHSCASCSSTLRLTG